MVAKVRDIAKVALQLPAKSRARLAETLLESLEEPGHDVIDALWAQEADDRVTAFESGKLKAIPANLVLHRLKAHKR
jgi:putative addiction module component (TIGR02574 family)